MTSPESNEVRTRALVIACGLGAVALSAAAVLVVVGLRLTGVGDTVIVTPRTATGSAGAHERAQRIDARRSAASHAKIPKGRLFARTSFWNKRLPATSPLDPSSAVLVRALVAEVERERTARIGPWLGASNGSTPLYRVGPRQPRVRVRVDSRNPHGRKGLSRAFAAVPIPIDAKPSVPRDRHMTVWQPSTDKLWEFYGARRRSDGWHADWGGAIRRVSASPGYYTGAAWPGAARNWGATASSLPVIGGTILVDDLKKGRIDHALAINLPAPRARAFAWPAQRTDGTGPATALPEGARLRLDPTLNLADLNLPRLTRMIGRAAQRYGFVVRDQTHHGILLSAENPSQFRKDPYSKYLLGRAPIELLANFPWDRLQALEMHLCTSAPCEPG